jgi:hypothetical protein
VLLLLILLLSSCTTSPAQQQACQGKQIVIGFAPGVDAALAGTAEGLSQDAGVTLAYMRHLLKWMLSGIL